MVPDLTLSSDHVKPFRNCMSRFCDDKAFLQTNRITRDQDLISLRSNLKDSQDAFVSADGHATWIIDTGASKTTSPFKEDFVPGSREIQGIAGNLTIEAEGIIRQEVVLDTGDIHIIEVPAWYIPEMPVRLLSPQQYLHEGINVPTGTEFNILAGKKARFKFGDLGELSVSYHHLSRLPTIRAYSNAYSAAQALNASECITSETNQNLSFPEKLLLQYHYILGHLRFLDVIWLGRQGYLGPKGQKMATGQFAAAPKCAACLFGKQGRTATPGKSTFNTNPGNLKKDKLVPGQLICSDQYQSRTEGITMGIQADGSISRDTRGGTLFVDAASGYIWISHQSGLNATETIESKLRFERKAAEAGVNVQSYHTDNGIYSSRQFLKELYEKQQDIHFSGVSAQFQNGVAENAIKNSVYRTHTQMMQNAIRWPDTYDERLWPLALSHAVHLHNTISKEAYGGLSPEEIFTGVKLDHASLQKLHPWGCPAYVLDPKLQEGRKIPKWAPRSRRGQYVGNSPLHASSIGLVRNLRTRHISPQFHIVYDNFFQTVYSEGDEPPTVWDELIQTSREYPDGFNKDDLPPLDAEWADEPLHAPKPKNNATRKQREPIMESEQPSENQREPNESPAQPTPPSNNVLSISAPPETPPMSPARPTSTSPARERPPPAPDPSICAQSATATQTENAQEIRI